MNTIQVLLIYSIIFISLQYAEIKVKLLKYCALFLVLVEGVFSIMSRAESWQGNKILIYAGDMSSAIHFVVGESACLFLDSAAISSPTFYSFNVKNFERHYHIKSEYINLDTNLFFSSDVAKVNNFIRNQEYSIYLLSRGQKLYPSANPPCVDVLYVRSNAKCNFSYLKKCINFQYVILDGTNTQYYEKCWKDSCDNYKIPYYSTRKSGYLALTK